MFSRRSYSALIRLTLIGALLSTLGVTLFAVPAVAQTGTVTASLRPATTGPVAVGDTFSLDLFISAGAQQVDGIGAMIQFPTQNFVVVDASGNPTNQITPDTVTLSDVLGNVVNNATGQIMYDAGKLSGTAPSGEFRVAVIRFKVVGTVPAAGVSITLNGTVLSLAGNALTAILQPAIVTGPSPLLCYVLTRSHSGSGNDPTASPANSTGCPDGQYIAGAAINLTASPASGWRVGSWSGTSNNSSTATTNSLTMPANTHTVSVTYVEIPPTCYTLVRTHTGSGSDPVASPVNSTGCPAGQYVAGAAINVTASPASGWRVGSWSGTSNNSSTATTNSLTMPANNHTVSVTYVEIPPTCYTLTRTHTGSGGDPMTRPTNSTGCLAEQYIAGASIILIAVPTNNSSVSSWSGTNDDGSTSIFNNLTMPASNHTVSVNYTETPGCAPSNNQVTLYADINYGGACVILDIGDYATPAALAPVGNDNVASLKVGANVQLALFQHDNFRGRSSTFLADDPDLSNDTIGINEASSVRVLPRDGRDAYEPDDTRAAAREIVSAAPQVRSIVPATDVDWASFTLDAQSAVVIETAGSSGDTVLWLLDGNGGQIAYDDDAGAGTFSRIERQCNVNALAAGTYYIKVGEYGNNAEIARYTLTLTATRCQADSQVRAFVRRFYQQCLNREPDQGGWDNWTNALVNGSLSGADLAEAFIFSDEFIRRQTSNAEFLNIMYRAFFNREPDAGGYNAWLAQLNSGTSRADVLYGFIHSQEFTNLCNAYGIRPYMSQQERVQAFVTRFYQQCLNRLPDPAGLAAWTNNLLSGAQTGADVAQGFIFSTEFTNRNTSNAEFLTIMYRAFFAREPDSGGYTAWLNALNGGTSRAAVLDGFTHSTEFANLCRIYGIRPF